MKKSYLAILGIVLMLAMASCARPYQKPHTEEIDSNTTAFLVNLEGDSKDGQAKLDSIDYYESAKVVAKRVTIAQRWEKTGRGDSEGRWIDTQRLIRVDRTPVTMMWYSETQGDGKGGYSVVQGAKADKPGLSTETKGSVGITVGLQLSGRIEEPDTARFLYYYGPNRDLKSVLNAEVYGTAGSLISNYAATYEDSAFIANKAVWTADLMKKLNEMYKPFGITISSVGGYGGNIFDNPAIQKSIDARLIAEKSKDAAQLEYEASLIKGKILDFRARDAEIELKSAQAAYIRMAGEKGIPLVPSTYVADGSKGGVIIDLGSKK